MSDVFQEYMDMFYSYIKVTLSVDLCLNMCLNIIYCNNYVHISGNMLFIYTNKGYTLEMLCLEFIYWDN